MWGRLASKEFFFTITSYEPTNYSSGGDVHLMGTLKLEEE